MSNLAVAYRQTDGVPWVGLPAAHRDPGASTLDMMTAANLLDWDIRLALVETPAKTDSDSYEVIRTDPTDGQDHRLAIVGQRYHTVQNEELATFADTLTDGGATLDSCGSYNRGRNVFFAFSLGDNIVLDPNGQADQIGRFLTVQSSNDGSTAVVAVNGNMRIQCQNMLTANRHAALSVFAMRHTASVSGRIADARSALGIAFKASSAFEQEMEALIQSEMDKDTFWNLVKSIHPEPEEDVRGSLAKWTTKTDTLMGLWSGDTVGTLGNTAYKAYNVLNEYLLWYTSPRGENGQENALVRASGLNVTANRQNLDLYRRVLATV